MSLINTVAELDAWMERHDRGNRRLGLVPTMGYLHAGHLSLIKKAKEENDLVVVSVFVNPTQFAPGEDYESYPRDIDRDYKLAAEAGADVVFHPAVEEIYAPGASTAVEVTGGLPKKLCGASRPTHFKGVTTVVNILFNIVKPDSAYFGQKDAQQVIIVKKMVRDLHMPVRVVACPIVREADGLAMSSRNIYLSEQERKAATALSRGLQKTEDFLKSGTKGCNETNTLRRLIEDEIKKEKLASVDYIEILDGETLEAIPSVLPGREALAALAVRFGKTRLIDNRLLCIPQKGENDALNHV